MPRSRKKPPVDEFPIPDDWQEYIGNLADNPAYQAAWAHAKSMNNSDKAAYIFADNKWQEFEVGGDYWVSEEKSPAELQREIDALMTAKEKAEKAEDAARAVAEAGADAS